MCACVYKRLTNLCLRIEESVYDIPISLKLILKY